MFDDVKSILDHGPGYFVFKIPDPTRFCALRAKLIELLGGSAMNHGDVDTFRKEIATLSNSQINDRMIKLLSFSDASSELALSCADLIETVCVGTKIFLQRRANFIFNLPGEDQRHQWPHYEMMSGISPFTYIIWMPLHDIKDEGGIFYLPQDESYDLMIQEEARGLVNSPWMFEKVSDRTPQPIKFGEGIIFNPFVLHGSTPFYGDHARIAVSIRFQSQSRPLMQRNSDFFRIFDLSKG